MSSVRVLVGTKKGAFILTSDGKRQNWAVSGPHFAGWEIYHLKGSPADPNRLYASQSSGWFGQVMQRSNDGGATWEPVDNKFVYEGTPGTHQWYDGTPHPWEFKRVWHLEPSLGDPDTVYAGVEDAAMFRTTDGGKSWHELAGLRNHGSGSQVAARRRRPRAPHDPARSRPTRNGCSSPSRRPARSAPTTAACTWTPINRGLKSQYIPDPEAEVGHCVHRIAMHPSRPEYALHAEALGRDAHRRRRRAVDRGERQPADRLRVSRSTCTRTSRRRSTWCRSRATRITFRPRASCASIAAAPADTNGSRSPNGLPQQDCYVNVLRDAMAVDRLDSCGVYFGTTGGQVYASADAGDTWAPIVRDLPAVLSVEVQTLP